MPKHMLYSAPFESRLETRERWRRVHMRPRVTKWLLMCIALAAAVTAFALWDWREQNPGWSLPATEAALCWLYLAVGTVR